MTQAFCKNRSKNCRSAVPLEKQVLEKRPIRRSPASPELIEQTRQLMEKTIEFIPDPLFEQVDARESLLATRPQSLENPPPSASAEPGLAFVSGLVQAPLLTPEEERYLFYWMNYLKFSADQWRRMLDLRHPDASVVARIHADLNDALQIRNQIVKGNLRLVVSLAKKLANSLEQMSDLISEGMAPLIRSVELFDVGLGNRFSTYATWAVRNQMLRLLKRIRLSPECQCGEDAPSFENLPDQRPPAEISQSMHQLRIQAVSRLLSSLSERERAVVSARFGLEGQPHGQSLAEIAGQLNLSKERVRQIVLLSLAKLQQSMTYDEFESLN